MTGIKSQLASARCRQQAGPSVERLFTDIVPLHINYRRGSFTGRSCASKSATGTRERTASRVAPVQERSSRPWGLGIGRSARTRACAPDDPRKRPTPRDLDPQPSPRQGVPSRAQVEHEQAGNPGLGPLRDDLTQGPVLRSLASRMAPSRWSVRKMRWLGCGLNPACTRQNHLPVTPLRLGPTIWATLRPAICGIRTAFMQDESRS